MIPEIEYYKLASKDLKKLREMIYEMEMSKSQNTKKDLCITSERLTEQWKKGELPSGWYWVELKEGTFADGKKSIVLDYFSELTNSFERHPYLVEQVLAEVPDYVEWRNMVNCACEEHEANKHLIEENAQLKELLKECSPYIAHSAASRTIKNSAGHKKDMKLLAKIDEALR